MAAELRQRWIVLVGAVAVLVAACSSATQTTTPDDTSADGAVSAAAAPAEEAASQEGQPAETTPATLPVLPTQPDGVPFPTEQWPEADLPAAVDAVELDTLLTDALETEDERYGRIEAAIVVVGGEIVAERYGRGLEPDEIHVSWSVAKSVAHALLGILAGDDRLDVFAPAEIAEWSAPDDPRGAITPDTLARMSSGLEWNESSDAVALVRSIDRFAAAGLQAGRPLVEDIDSVFNYSTGTTAVNGRVIGDLVGTGDDFVAWADEVLFTPLGIDRVELAIDADGYWAAGWGADMSARDFARFGLLYLRDGVWDGERILPEGWVDYARTPGPTADFYGAGFWLDFYGEDMFSAEGFLGQKVVMVPDDDLLVVILANNPDDAPTARFATELIGLFRARV